MVARGNSQKHGVDFDEVSLLIALFETIRLIVSMATQIGWKIYQMNVISVFFLMDSTREMYAYYNLLGM